MLGTSKVTYLRSSNLLISANSYLIKQFPLNKVWLQEPVLSLSCEKRTNVARCLGRKLGIVRSKSKVKQLYFIHALYLKLQACGAVYMKQILNTNGTEIY